MNELAERVCLVTGASGFVGGWVVERLLERGARVRCLLRPTSNRSFLPVNRVEIAAGDVTDPASVERAVAGSDFVFHAAGLIKARDPSEYVRVNRDGTVHVLEAARSQRVPVRRVVVVSSLAAIGPSAPGQPAEAWWEPHPFSPYGESKQLAEAAAWTFAADLPITIVRPPSVYGPRDREMFQLMRLASLPIRPRFGTGSAVSTIHVSDLVDGILLAATHASAVGKAFFLACDETPTIDGLMEIVRKALGTRGVSVTVPSTVTLAAGWTSELVRNLTGIPTIFDRWKAREIVRGYWACSNQRAKLELGFEPRFSLNAGIADTVRWYRKMGWLR